ncbi:MAG TPA: hypothetical protein DDZ96_00455 [Porphyromonadaceae bacterium]|jgi:hypothetical protein|nr:hypothetical protein [Porphyromonadaceae bacterium]HBL32274.1 hypothetical protein [Porphyromonadaceae bacterium]HCM20349.1 hypothetical protein [Porphyromonadaceae bacterium]
MAIIIKTETPDTLLDEIYEGIQSKKVDKWASTADGRLTYASLLWKNEAWFKPQIWVEEKELRFGLIKRKDRKHISTKLYTMFHTKFVEMLLSHFDTLFREVTVSAVRTEPDEF